MVHHHHQLPVWVLVGAVFSIAGVHGISSSSSISQEGRNRDGDPMLAAESSAVRFGGSSGGSGSSSSLNLDSMPPLSRRYFELMKRSAISPLLTTPSAPSPAKISPRAASSAFFTRPSYEPEQKMMMMDQQKAASEYWGSSSQEEDGGYSGGPGGIDSMEQEPYEQYGHGGGGGGGGGYQSGGYHGGGGGGGGGYKHDMSGYMKGKEITITPDHKPITLHYRTHSQPIMVHQTRIPGPKPEVKYTKSHEEPHRVVHEVVRPIIQDVREIIQPYRRVTQEIRPVQEEIRTLVAKSSGSGVGGGAGGGAGNGGGGGAGGHMSYGHGGGGGMSYGGLSAESKQLYTKAVLSAATGHLMGHHQQLYEPSPSESGHRTMAAMPASSMVLRRSKVFLKNGIPVYQSNYMGPAVPVMAGRQ